MEIKSWKSATESNHCFFAWRTIRNKIFNIRNTKAVITVQLQRLFDLINSSLSFNRKNTSFNYSLINICFGVTGLSQSRLKANWTEFTKSGPVRGKLDFFSFLGLRSKLTAQPFSFQAWLQSKECRVRLCISVEYRICIIHWSNYRVMWIIKKIVGL